MAEIVGYVEVRFLARVTVNSLRFESQESDALFDMGQELVKRIDKLVVRCSGSNAPSRAEVIAVSHCVYGADDISELDKPILSYKECLIDLELKANK